MAQYVITAPDGKKYRVSGDGTQEEALAAFQAQYKPASVDPAPDPSAGGGTLQIGSPIGWPSGTLDTGIKTPQWLDRTLSGIGKFPVDMARGAGQMLGMVDQQKIDEAKKLDAPLMRTGAGKVGNVLGGAAFAAPAMLIPGANTAVGASLIGAGVGASQPVATGDSRIANAAFGGAGGLAGYGVGKGISALAGRARAPGGANSSSTATANVAPSASSANATASGAVNLNARSGINYGSVGPDPSAGLNGPLREALDAGRQMGMRTTPGQATGSRALQQMEAKLASQPMTSGRFNAIDAKNQGVLGRVASRAIGEDAENVSAEVIDNAFTRLGKVFDDAGDDVARAINPDDFVSKLTAIEEGSQGLLTGTKSVIDHPLVRDLYTLASRGEATGQQLANISSKLGKAVNTNMRSAGGDRQLGMALGEVKDLTDDLLTQGMSGDRLSKLMQARGQYRTLLTLVNNQGVIDPVSGHVSGKTLANVLQRGDRTGFTRGRNQGDLYTAARFARGFGDKIGNSGTATRMPMNTMEMAASVPFSLAARAYTSNPAINLALRSQAAANAAGPVMRPMFGAIDPFAQRLLPGAGGLFGTYAAQ